MPDIHDITAPGAYIPEATTPWWVWLLVALGTLALLAVAYLVYKKLTTKLTQKQPSIQDARADLQELRENAPQMAPNSIATELSLITRRYLEATLADKALFETNEEFTLRPDALAELPTDLNIQVTGYLGELSQLKYAPSQPIGQDSPLSDSIHEHIHQASTLLSHVESHLTQETKPSESI